MNNIAAVILLLFLCATSAAHAACDFNRLVDESTLLQQGFTDASSRLLQDDKEKARAQTVMPSVKRIFLSAETQTMAMYGWQNTAVSSAEELSQHLATMKENASKQKFDIASQALDEDSRFIRYDIDYQRKDWPQKESGLEALDSNNCWLSVKFGYAIANHNDKAVKVQNLIAADISRIHQALDTDLQKKESEFMNKAFTGQLPTFSLDIFIELLLPTLLLTVIVGFIVHRAAQNTGNIHTRIFCKLFAAFWIGYAIFVAFTHQSVVGLELYVYAAIMIAFGIIAFLLGSGLILVLTSLCIGHILRSTLFIMFQIEISPRMVWFDVGLLSILTIYALSMGFKRRSQQRELRHSVNVVDRDS